LTLANQKFEKIQAEKEEKYNVLFIFEEIWIFNETGMLLFTHAPGFDLNPELFAGFINAILNFSIELTSESLKSINIGFDKYTLYKGDSPFFIVGRSSTNFSVKFIEKVFKIIYNAFWMNFANIIQNFKDDNSIFSDFEKILQGLKYSHLDYESG